jgi:hypothetical protein
MNYGCYLVTLTSLEHQKTAIIRGGNVDDMIKFNGTISARALVELPLKGRMFTWSNMQEQPSLEQLDWCFFTTVEWTSTFPNTLVASC